MGAETEAGAVRLVEGVATVDDLDAFLGVLDGVADEYGCTVQAFDARYVVSRRQLSRAVELADRAIGRGENVARERAVEVLLYAAGRRQIDQALTMGVSEGESPVVVLVDGGEAGEGEDESGRADEDEGEIRDGSGRRSPGAGDEASAAAAVVDAAPIDPSGTLGAYDAERVREFFDVGDRELSATHGTLADLVEERVALLDVKK